MRMGRGANDATGPGHLATRPGPDWLLGGLYSGAGGREAAVAPVPAIVVAPGRLHGEGPRREVRVVLGLPDALVGVLVAVLVVPGRVAVLIDEGVRHRLCILVAREDRHAVEQTRVARVHRVH